MILLHGYAGDRRASLGRVRFLRAAGFATLCIDLRSHGESDGDRVTFGQQEPHGVRAAVKFVRARRPGLPVICLGESLGGVACLLGEPPLAVDALIVEMVFPTMHEAVSNRVTAYLGGLASAVVTPLLTYQCAWRMDASLDELAPELAIHRVRAPLFVIGGEFDDRTPPAETRRLFAAANEPKELWIVPGAGHQNLHSKAGSVYEQRILAFLQRHVPGK